MTAMSAPVQDVPALRFLLRLLWIKLRSHPYVEFTDTGTAVYFLEYGHDRMRVG